MYARKSIWDDTRHLALEPRHKEVAVLETEVLREEAGVGHENEFHFGNIEVAVPVDYPGEDVHLKI